MIIKTICPKCKHKQSYENRVKSIISCKKKCVYCNHTFKIYKNFNDHQIFEIEK